MGRNKVAWFVYGIIGLAVIGLVSQLFTNPANLFKNIFIMTIVGLAIFGAVYFIFLRKRGTSNDMKKYKQAVKQSKLRYKHQRPNQTSTLSNRQYSGQTRRRLNRRAPHLRVIDGNKSKRKNRATF